MWKIFTSVGTHDHTHDRRSPYPLNPRGWLKPGPLLIMDIVAGNPKNLRRIGSVGSFETLSGYFIAAFGEKCSL